MKKSTYHEEKKAELKDSLTSAALTVGAIITPIVGILYLLKSTSP